MPYQFVFIFQVSPQFNPSHTPRNVQRRQQNRHRRHSVATQNITKAPLMFDKENTDSHQIMTRRMRKFTSLKFLGEKSAMTTVVEDLNISIDSETASESEAMAKENYIDNTESPNVNSDLIRVNTRKRSRTGSRVETTSSRLNVCSGDKNSNKGLENDVQNNILLGSNQRAPAPIKRLFGGQLREIRTLSELQNESNGSNVRNRIINDVCDRVSVTSKLFSDEISETSEEEASIPAVLRSYRLRNMHRLLALDSTPKCNDKSVLVLAPDTPEEKYGWSMREKQLCKHRHKKVES